MYVFDPSITQSEFDQISLLAGEAIFASPVDSPGTVGLLDIEIGIAANAIEVDETASYWAKSVSDDILVEGRLLVPRLIVSKGFGAASLTASYGRVGDSDAEVWGGSLELPIIRGSITRPVLAIRGVYSQLQGVEEAELKTTGALVLLGKGFGPITPYAGWGKMWVESEGIVHLPVGDPMILTSDLDQDVLLLGAKLDMLFFKLAVEGTEGTEEWRYSARIAIGF